MFGDNDASDLQQQILHVYDQNPDMEPKYIADWCDCSTSYVHQTIKEYRSGFGGDPDAGGFSENTSSSQTTLPTGDVDLSDAPRSVRFLVELMMVAIVIYALWAVLHNLYGIPMPF